MVGAARLRAMATYFTLVARLIVDIIILQSEEVVSMLKSGVQAAGE